MRVLIINPILYTAEKKIKKLNSIKDTMIYNLCLAFKKSGHSPVLVAAEDYKPVVNEKFDFEIKFFKCRFKKIFKPSRIPYLKNLRKYIVDNKDNFDLIISSEVFSLASLFLVLTVKNKVIIWQELAKHNNMLFKLPSLFWYNVIARIFFRNILVIPRSNFAYKFISKYCKNVSRNFIDHGVSLEKFECNFEKSDHFIILSQLIKRKRIDGLLKAFYDFTKNNKSNFLLYVVGSGEEEENLKSLTKELNIQDKVIFTGFLPHKKVIPLLSSAKELLINTEKDNNMVSIVESIAVATPIVTTSVPYNCPYISKYKLGIVNDNITHTDLLKIVDRNCFFVNNCKKYRNKISNSFKVKQFILEYQAMNKKNIEGRS